MKRMLHAVALSLLLSGLGCNQEEVVVRTAEGQESAIGRYSSFGIALPDPEELKEEGMSGDALHQIAQLSLEQMQQRGYQPKKLEEADLLIAFGPNVQIYGTPHTKSQTGYVDEKYDQTLRAQGKLTVVFLDTKTKQVLLKRTAETRLLQSGPSDEKMRQGVAQLFDGIPRAAGAPAPAAAPAAPGAPAASASAEAPPAPATAEASAAPKPTP